MPAKARVLIVDDEPSYCKEIHTLLRGEDYELHTAGSGQAAIDVIETSHGVDLVLLDLNLPDMNGFKVMEYLSKNAPGALVVIMTGYASLESATEALRCGAYDYLTKPFAKEELLKTLQNALTHKQVKTAHQQAEQALEESERSFRNLVENILSGVLIIRDLELLFQNTIQKELFGPITEVILSRNFEHICTDDIENLKEVLEKIMCQEVSAAETDFTFHMPVDSGGQEELRRVLSRMSRISYLGEVAILVNTMDISGLKEPERLAIRNSAQTPAT